LRQQCNDTGALLIFDEIQSGFGRTGKMFASDYCENKPDIFCLSKGLTGGFMPLGLTTTNDRIASAFDPLDIEKTFFHGHSYTGNPMACAAALASLKILGKKKTQQRINRIHELHANQVENLSILSGVKDVRLTGTILAIELDAEVEGYSSEKKTLIYEHFLSRGILLRPLGNIIYLIPPYVISEEDLERVYQEIILFLKNQP
jgi:adenosylmethionine-8-amino-7-oxononanoate aminotransferase